MTAVEEPKAVQNKGTNYRARRTFGTYPEGTVFPRWRLAFAGDVDEMVRRGMVEPTADPVTVKFEVPKVDEKPAEPVPDADTQKKLNEAEEVLAALRQENEGLREKVAELEKSQHARLIEWGKATDQHAFERAADAAKVREAQDAEKAVRDELRTAYDRIADLEKKLAAGGKKDRKDTAKSEPAPAAPTT